MFEHSVKVPRLYKNAAKILKDVKENGKSIKQLVYECRHRNLKAVYALVAETLKHFSDIDTIIRESQLLEKENRFDPWLARILIIEMLWKGKQLPSQAKPIQTMQLYYDTLKHHKDNIDSQTQSTDLVKRVQKPRFARINTLKITIAEAIDAFREEGWSLDRFTSGNYDEYIAKSSSLQQGEFIIDIHIKELLIFSSDTQFYKHAAYKSGLILLQDKASCLAAHLLNPTPGSIVLDMCAAPGMKTTHAAALLNNEGTVYAVEKNEKRFKILNDIVENAGATCVKTINKDSVDLTAQDCPDVEYILVDPSCSGSGMVDRITIDNKQEEIDPGRLKKLSDFQAVILNHALRKFPKVKRVVYSTCSIFPEENEHVVSRVLQRFPNFKLVSAKELLNGVWTNSPSESDSPITEKCLYAKPEKDLTNGFFIAVIERIDPQDQDNVSIYNDQNQLKRKKFKRDERKISFNEDTESEYKIDKNNQKKSKVELEEITSNDCVNDDIVPKKKKRHQQTQEEINNIEMNDEATTSKRKHKKKKLKEIEDTEETADFTNDETFKRKSKKKRKHSETNNEQDDNELNENMDENETKEKSKHKKRSKKVENDISKDNLEVTEEENLTSKPKKKKRKHSENLVENNEMTETLKEESQTSEKKTHKKREKNNAEIFEHTLESNQEENTETKQKKKEKKKGHEKEIIEEVRTPLDTKRRKKKKGLVETENYEDPKEHKSYEEHNTDTLKKHKNKKNKNKSN